MTDSDPLQTRERCSFTLSINLVPFKRAEHIQGRVNGIKYFSDVKLLTLAVDNAIADTNTAMMMVNQANRDLSWQVLTP